MYTLFFSPNACSLASHIALAESGLPYEIKWVKFADKEQQSEAYLKINPKGRVPALAADRGIITESVAILAFIAQAAPEAKLAPLDDPFLFGKMQAFNAYIASTVHVAYAHWRRGYRWADNQSSFDDMVAKAPKVFHDSFQVIEDSLLEGPYVLGETYSVADAYLYLMTDWLANMKLDRADFPKVNAHYERMKQRPAVQRALAEQAAATAV
ncbi:glutathione S-transferase family protein [Neorhizobium galegae]|uniref:glutathione S-transferase family protein n=1 Tax=Neorhizobium galegae TaxID=399 RepID=UPI000621841E|nr:glutathione S-transferase family protein [Neorhizobium galegae]KAB1126681.1 glutathione S-transferase family protein [Neorhizobium galegae]MCQ1808347.1 glutathione S-transferase family protein [Neorhizobium galegae]CDZ61108.1 Glutathione S-transferase [Neorhizobium galegae bv. orientalis]